MTIRNDRPRIWLNPQILTTLKARAAKPTSRWQTLLQWGAKPADWGVGIVNYALLYAVTGNTAYSDKAWSLMDQSMQVGLSQITGDNGYQARNYFPASAIVLDWCYPALTTDQRTKLVTDMEACCDWVWPSTNPSRKGSWAVDAPLNNYWWGFQLVGMAGLAMMGESAKAPTYVSQAVDRWNTIGLPALTAQATGGYIPEGTAYETGSLRSMMWWLLAHSTATDQDLLTPQLASGWVQDAITCQIQLSTPTLDRIAPLGDQALSSGSELTDYNRAVGLIAAAYGNQPALDWLNGMKPAISTQVLNAWQEFLFFPEVL